MLFRPAAEAACDCRMVWLRLWLHKALRIDCC